MLSRPFDYADPPAEVGIFGERELKAECRSAPELRVGPALIGSPLNGPTLKVQQLLH